MSYRVEAHWRNGTVTRRTYPSRTQAEQAQWRLENTRFRFGLLYTVVKSNYD